MAEDRKWTEMTVRGKITHIITNITIEPVIALYLVLSNTISIVSVTFKLEKSCVVNNHYPETLCQAILDGTETNDTMVNNIQKTVSQMSSWVDPIQSVLMFTLLLFIGSWSDRNRRRKPCLLLPLGGEALSMCGLLLCTYFFALPVQVNGLVQSILPGVTGGLMCIEIAIFSYVSDITTEDERTFRIGLVSTLITITQPFGSYFSAIIYQYGKYYGTFGTCAVLYGVAMLYVALLLREPRTPKPVQGFCKDFFDYTHITDTVRTVSRRRDGRGRMKIILVVVLSVLLTAPIIGEGKVGQLFLMKQLNWDIYNISHYVTFYYTVTIVGSFMVLGLLGSNLKVNDSILGVVACLMKIIVNTLYTFSKDGQTFYILAILEILSTASVTMIRSITTKLVQAEELGKLYAFCGIASAASTIIVPSIYDLVYLFTIDTLPGAFFLLGAGINALAVIIFLCINRLQKQKPVVADISNTAVDNKGFEDIDLNSDITSVNTKL
uniref:Major facilitator superfamily (MFS) profile domain-containing protein n=1 Tax=Clastoptera arizonana TaxID=38151 RepID=A0A1B6E1L9_9HEMI